MKNLVPALIALLFIASCRDKETGKKITSISFTPSSSNVAVGLTQQLTATVEPADAAKKELFWSIDDVSKATVDATGKVTGLMEGTAIITATAADGSNTQGTVTIKVTPKATSVVIVPANPSVGVGGKRTLTAVAFPANAAQAVTWTSSDPSKATIDASTGTVTGIALGSTTITAIVADGGNIAGTATLTVNNTVIALGDEHFAVEVAAGGTFTLAHAPRTVASDIKAVKVHIATAANAVIKAGNTVFTSGNTVDFTAPVTFTVTAQGGAAKSYTVGIAAYNAVANPYGIYTVKHLADVANGLTASFLLKNNIDLPNADAAGAAATGMGDYADAGWLPLEPFTGTFDGGNFSINNFYVNRRADNVGLFAYIGEGSNVKNLGVNGVTNRTAATGVSSRSGQYTGILAGYSKGIIDKCYATGSVSASSSVFSSPGGGLVGHNSGTISNSYATGNVSASADAPLAPLLGGLAGQNRGTISDSYATGNVSSSSHAGGLVGWNHEAISNSYATGNVSARFRAGGLAGQSSGGHISNSYATGNVSASSSGTATAGGLAGQSSARISNSYATGNVSAAATAAAATSAAGGLVGDSYGNGNGIGSISNSYATGNVSATATAAATSKVGGLAGDNNGGTYTNCHRNRNAAITKNNADAAPDDDALPGIVARAKADMQTDTFKGILNGTGTVWGREDGRNDKLPYIIGVGVGK